MNAKKPFATSIMNFMVTFMYGTMVVVAIALFVVLIMVVMNLAVDKTVDTMQLTNVGFAMFVGISTMLFNWGRVMNPKFFTNEINLINSAAIRSIVGSCLFLLSSAVKYFGKLYFETHDTTSLFFRLTRTTSIMLFLGALLIAFFVILSIFIAYFKVQKYSYVGISFDYGSNAPLVPTVFPERQRAENVKEVSNEEASDQTVKDD